MLVAPTILGVFDLLLQFGVIDLMLDRSRPLHGGVCMILPFHPNDEAVPYLLSAEYPLDGVERVIADLIIPSDAWVLEVPVDGYVDLRWPSLRTRIPGKSKYP